MRSWRTASVSLLSFSSGLPLGLVWIAIPDWMRSIGVDIRVVGIFALAQAPWTFKMLWSPLMDRYVPPWWGRRRGWICLAQIALLILTLALAGVGSHPDTPWVVGALALSIAFAGATQDIALDGYAVEVLRKEEQGVAVGARIAIYRAAMLVAGGTAITLAGHFSWVWVNFLLGLCYVPMLFITWKAPEPEERFSAPPSLKDAVWEPFLGFLSRHRALEILTFVILYKLSDNLGQALLRPFLFDMGYSGDHRGISLATVGLICTLGGTFIGGVFTNFIGLGHSLWVFGFLQVFSNIGYVFLASSEVNLALMYGALGFETLTQGMGTGAFSVLLLRMTQKRFSVTQYALFSSLFALARVFAGPVTGFLVYALGWSTFFWITIVAGIPGLLMLARFSPLGTREPEFTVEEIQKDSPLTHRQLFVRGLAGALIGWSVPLGIMVLRNILKAIYTEAQFVELFINSIKELGQTWTGWIQLAGILSCGLVLGLLTAAYFAARRGVVLKK